MRTKLGIGMMLLLLATARAEAARSMVCHVWGCSADSVRLDEWSGSWVFEFLEGVVTDYPLNHDFTAFLRKAKLIDEGDRVDHVWLEIDKKHCAESRRGGGTAIGDLACRGPVSHVTARVRQGETFAPGRRAFKWRIISSPDTRPWLFDLRMLPAAGDVEAHWAITLSTELATHEFFPFQINYCRRPF